MTVITKREKLTILFMVLVIVICLLFSLHNFIIAHIFDLDIRLFYCNNESFIITPYRIWVIGWLAALSLFYFFIRNIIRRIKCKQKTSYRLLMIPFFVLYLIIYFPLLIFSFSHQLWLGIHIFSLVVLITYLISELFSFMNTYEKRTKNLAIALKGRRLNAAEKRRMEYELREARRMQEAILPVSYTEFNFKFKITIYAHLSPAKYVSGDFYTYSMLLDGRKLFFALGDISGKGMSAAMFMLRVDNLIKERLLKFTGCLSEFMFELNNKLKFNNEYCMFTTLCCCVLDTKTGKLEVINAGHTLPIIAKNGVHKLLETHINPMVGAVKDVQFKANEITLVEGNRLILYSDGLIDFPLEKNKTFSVENLIEEFDALGSIELKQAIELIKNKIKNSQGNNIMDDITLLGIALKPTSKRTGFTDFFKS